MQADAASRPGFIPIHAAPFFRNLEGGTIQCNAVGIDYQTRGKCQQDRSAALRLQKAHLEECASPLRRPYKWRIARAPWNQPKTAYQHLLDRSFLLMQTCY